MRQKLSSDSKSQVVTHNIVSLNNVIAFYGQLTGFGENEMNQPKMYSIV